MSRYPNRAALPGPWGAQRYPLPSPLPESPFVFVRPHMYPRFADRFLAFFSTPMVQAMISPLMAASSYSKSPVGGMGLLQQERTAMAELKRAGFANHTGIDYRAWAPENLVPTRMPPVSRERVRSGAGVVPYWSVPFQPRSQPPESVMETITFARNTLRRAERGSVHTQLAMANRGAIIRRAFGG
jgi:hypothetical protein